MSQTLTTVVAPKRFRSWKKHTFHHLTMLIWGAVIFLKPINQLNQAKPKIPRLVYIITHKLILGKNGVMIIIILLYVFVNTHSSYLYEGAERAVCRVVGDQESHVLVAQFDWCRTIHGGQCNLWPLHMSNLLLLMSQMSAGNEPSITKNWTGAPFKVR